MILLEGGNVIPNAKPINKADFPAAVKNLQKILPKGINLYPIGSAGKKEVSSDIDALIDANELMKAFPAKELKLSRKALEDYFKNKGLPAARTGVSIHVGVPTGAGDDIVQVDLMAVENAKAVQPLHTHDYTDPTMKGGTLHAMWADLANMSSTAKHKSLMMSPYKGLVNRETKELVTNDKDQIAKIIIGPTATADDMGNPTKMMKALIKYPDKYKAIKDKYFSEQLTESTDVGRKYQHIEDLVISHGSHGGLHAVERLRDMATTGGSLELKWDGMPVVYWGRDEQGNFMMIPKNAWAYLKRGQTQTKTGMPTLTKSPQDVAKFILGTGSGDPQQRKEFAKQFAMLWPYFEKISPKKGFLEGGLLFYPGTKPDGQTAMPVLNQKTKTYDFKPNITTFHIPVDSELGQKISKAKIGVAATGFYPTLGSSDEQRYPNAQQLSTSDVFVQGTTFVENPVPFKNLKMLDNLENFLKTNSNKIDNFLKPKPGIKNPSQEIYSYLNKHLRKEGLVRDFPKWAKENLSDTKAKTLLSDKEGLVATLGAIEAISREKLNFIKEINKMTHGSIRQTKPEGYAQAHPGRKFKYDIPGQFIKMTDPQTWRPEQSVLKESNNTKNAVLGWGRGMGHTGHDALVQAVIHQAEKNNAQPFFVVSRSFGKDDPIPPEMKLQMYQKKFPKHKNIFSLPSADKPTLNDVLTDLASKGYKDVSLVVGADQKDAFGYLLKPAKSTGVEPYKSFGLNNLSVMSRQDTKAPGSDPTSSDYHEGPRATPMRQALLDPNVSDEQKFKIWRQAMSKSLSDQEVLNMMKIAKNNLVKFNMPKVKKQKLKELLQSIKPLIENATPEQKAKLFSILEKAKEEQTAKKQYDYDQGYIDPTLYTDLNWIKQHYPMARTKEEAFIKFVQRSLKHSKEDSDRHQEEIDLLKNKVEKLEKLIKKISQSKKTTVESVNFIEEK